MNNETINKMYVEVKKTYKEIEELKRDIDTKIFKLTELYWSLGIEEFINKEGDKDIDTKIFELTELYWSLGILGIEEFINKEGDKNNE